MHTHTHTHTSTYTQPHTHLHAYTLTLTHTHTHTRQRVRVSAYTYIHTHTLTHSLKDTHTHTYTRARKHIHTRTYRHAHTHTYKICFRFFWIFENLRHMCAKKTCFPQENMCNFADTGKLTIMTMTIKKLQLWPHLNGRKCTHIYTSRPPPHSKTVRRLLTAPPNIRCHVTILAS